MHAAGSGVGEDTVRLGHTARGPPRRRAGDVSLSLADLWALQQAQAAPKTAASASANTKASFGRAKRIILLYLYGAAAQHETFDPKPEAPAKIRGIFKPIDTAVPGLQICEHLPNVARIADRVAIVRSMTHPYNIHSAAYTLTGVDKVDIPMELNPYDRRHWPFFGSVLDYLAARKHPKAPSPQVPRDIGLPFQFSSRCPEFKRGGPYGGFLGRSVNPVWAEFDGAATKAVDRWRGERDVSVGDPYLGISLRDRFTVSEAARLSPDITLDRLNRRRDLVTQFDEGRRSLDQALSTQTLGRFQEMAYSLMTSRGLRVRARRVAGAGRLARAVWDDALRPGDARGPAVARGGGDAGVGFLGRDSDGQLGVGHALQPL